MDLIAMNKLVNDVESPTSNMAVPAAVPGSRRFTSFTIDAILIDSDKDKSTAEVDRGSAPEADLGNGDLILPQNNDETERGSWLRHMHQRDVVADSGRHGDSDEGENQYVDVGVSVSRRNIGETSSLSGIVRVTADRQPQQLSMESITSSINVASDIKRAVSSSYDLEPVFGGCVRHHQAQQQQHYHHGGKMQSNTTLTNAMSSSFYAPFQRHSAMTSHPFLMSAIDGN